MKTIEIYRTGGKRPASRLVAFLKEAIVEYFSPIFVSWKSVEALSKKVSSLSKNAELELYSKKGLIVVQNAVCFNQSALIQFTYLLAERHKVLKEARSKSPDNYSEIEKYAKDLVYFLNVEFHKIVLRNFEILHSYFDGRSKVKPRICIKGNINTYYSNMVITVFRDSESSYNLDYDISKNTGFSEIAKTGKYYLCNNIPEAVARGEYKNPRINDSLVKKYRNLFIGKSITLDEWKKYWVDSATVNDDRSFYKSTLIIPMTLWNNELSDEFKKRINIKDIGRTIFGFLCIDHVEEDYFKEPDVRVGYVFADLISHYIFQRSVYTDLSKTFNKIIKELGSRSLSVSKTLEDYMPTDVKPVTDDLKLELKQTTDNYLFGIDEELLEYIGKGEHITKP